MRNNTYINILVISVCGVSIFFLAKQTTAEAATSNITTNTEIYLHGIGKGGDNVNPHSIGTTAPIHKAPEFTAEIYSTNGALVFTIKQALTYDSATGGFPVSISIPSYAPRGQYTVKVKTSGFLQQQLSGTITLTSDTVSVIPPVYLISGDINNDNQLDIQDYNILISCYASKFTTPSCLSPATSHDYGADIDDDGVVDGTDYNLFLREIAALNGNSK